MAAGSKDVDAWPSRARVWGRGWRVGGIAVTAATLGALAALSAGAQGGQVSALARGTGFFNRIATFPVAGAVAEIVAATPDGRTLIYTDSEEQQLGFVDISNPSTPTQTGILGVPGEPTSVSTTPDGRWALASVHGDTDSLVVVDLADRSIEATLPLAGQPDSIAVSGDGRFAAIAIENERDEDVDEGRMPQAPAGFLTIVDLVGAPGAWTTRDVALTGIAGRFPDDPEPEFVDINGENIAAVTLQENNHVVLVRLADGSIVGNWTAGVTSRPADITSDGDVRFDGVLGSARREPDAIAWTPGGRLITANEGDYTLDLAPGEFAGSRDFTVFGADGSVVFEPGASLEQIAALHGHYPDSRSRSKGAEFEGAEVGIFGGTPFAFIGSERGDFVAVYDLSDETRPRFVQLLPTGDAPEGLLAIPGRNLFVTSNEGDGSLSLYAFTQRGRAPEYPQVVSDQIPWAALSGLANGRGPLVYAVPDSAVKPSRIWEMRVGRSRAVITRSIPLPKSYDLEGIAVQPRGGWWVVSEGAGNAGGTGLTRNLLVRVNRDGSIAEEVQLPDELNAHQRSSGYEGVAVTASGAQVYVCIQREWADDPAGRVKIGRYTPATGEWRFFHYPLDAPPAGGWVGLSEITRINDTTFAVIERDNQSGAAARVKRIYRFSTAGLTPAPAGSPLPLLQKTLVRDLLEQDEFRLEKAEGLALLGPGSFFLVNDNDGAGETRTVRFRSRGGR